MYYRRQQAYQRRLDAALLAHDRPHPRHISNGDEHKFRHTPQTDKWHNAQREDGKVIDYLRQPSYMLSFTKGLAHNKETGLVQNPDDFQRLIKGIDSGDPRDFLDAPQGPLTDNGKWRGWESQAAGLAFDLEGPDAQAVTMPPAPRLGSDELIAEMGELYVQALLRDVPFNTYTPEKDRDGNISGLHIDTTDKNTVDDHVALLAKLPWFAGTSTQKLSPQEVARLRPGIDRTTAFRGIAAGDNVGPYLSQFLLVGNTGINSVSKDRDASDGLISYGSIRIDQRVRVAKPKVDYLTGWEKWLQVQNGLDLRKAEEYVDQTKQEGYRFIFTPRDLATYVHYDALYEAYLNACLILWANDTPLDPGVPFLLADETDHQQGFAHFGGPHILSLVTEVATRALKAVRFQKFNVHRRCRPEVLAARLQKVEALKGIAPDLQLMWDELECADILPKVKKHNNAQANSDKNSILLPMAFQEGSPMHPAYGAGHATVAGACVTILKAFFDHGHRLDFTRKKGDKDLGQSYAYVSVEDGKRLDKVPVYTHDGKPAYLTVEGELNKLAANIAIGRDWGGVHYFTDYYESILLGEQIAIGILEEQKLNFGENFSMTVPLFNGDTYRI